MTPKFLTQEIAEKAVETALQIMQSSPISQMFKRQTCYIVVLCPEIDGQPDQIEYPARPITPAAIYERSFGNPDTWSADYEKIAKSKALQLWQGLNDSRTDIRAHLLFSGDTPYWGGVKRHGIAVACSGVQPWFDQMLSGMIADMIKAMAYNAWILSEDHKEEVELLT